MTPGAAGRYLLDTQIVDYGWRYHIGSEDSTVATLTDWRHRKLNDDLQALDTLFRLAHHGALEFRVALHTLRELAASPDVIADEVMAWGIELADYAAPDDWHDDASSRRQAPIFDDFVRPGDAILVAEAIRLECAGLLTCDYPLHRKRARIKRVAGIEILRPTELLRALT